MAVKFCKLLIRRELALRPSMVQSGNYRGDGFWASSKIATKDSYGDSYGGAFPWPVANVNPFSFQMPFIESLLHLQSSMKICLRYTRGPCHHRLEENKSVPNGMYQDRKENVN
jgi:hypothetical protein